MTYEQVLTRGLPNPVRETSQEQSDGPDSQGPSRYPRPRKGGLPDGRPRELWRTNFRTRRQ